MGCGRYACPCTLLYDLRCLGRKGEHYMADSRRRRRRRASRGNLSGLRIYGLIALVCVGISVLFHFLSLRSSQVSLLSEQMIQQATEQAVSEQVQQATRRR